VGFAFRDVLQNFLAGILILLTEPFQVDDQIIVGDYEGTVERIDIRATLIKTYDSRRVVMPNATLFTDSVLVNTAFAKRRSDYDIGIGYGDDVDEACRLILEAIETVPEVCREPAPSVRIWELAPAAINIRARWWTDSRRSDVVLLKSKVIVAIVKKLSQHGIDMPFPTQMVLFHDQTEEADGDRLRQREGWPPERDGAAPRPLTIAGSLQRLVDAIADRQNGEETLFRPRTG
jgi:small-conductance mechanosensitive channel